MSHKYKLEVKQKGLRQCQTAKRATLAVVGGSIVWPDERCEARGLPLNTNTA